MRLLGPSLSVEGEAGGEIFNLAGIGPVARRLQQGLLRIGTLKINKQWQIQRIEPDHRFSALMAVIMPFTARGQDQIAFLHWQLLAIDNGITAFAFNNDPRSRGRVTMGRGRFPG